MHTSKTVAETTVAEMEAVSRFSAQLLLHTIIFTLSSASLAKLSVPEKHFLIMSCSVNYQVDTSQVVWTHRDTLVIKSTTGNAVSNLNRPKYSLLLDGSLMVNNLQDEDSGMYYCNKHIVADVQVLKGDSYNVSVGRTILLPCRVSEKLKQKWMFRKDKRSKRKLVSQMFRNGTVVKEMDDPQNRFTQTDNELKIVNLQPEDAGEYFCNSHKVVTVNVMTEMEDSGDTGTEPESVLRAVMVGICVVIPLAAVLGLFLGIRVKRRKTGEQNGPEQLKFLEDGNRNTESVKEYSDVHYASLGHQDWTERPVVQETHQQVIYSTVVQ